MNNPLYLFVGQSGSGKSTIVNTLVEKYSSLKPVHSYTTRPWRYEGEVGHIFVTNEEFDNLKELVAYTEYNNCRYCATATQLDECNMYVIDVAGVEYLLNKYNRPERPIFIFYFDCNTKNRVERMIDRGDSDSAIISRLMQDGEDNWLDQLDALCAKHTNKFVEVVKINANKNTKLVLEQVEDYIFPF